MQEQAILVLEDTPEMQMILAAILSPKYLIKIVSSAEEAHKELEKKQYSLILVDVDLPGESGFQFCAGLKLDDRFRNVPLIFLTAHDQTPDIVMGFSLGAEDYITKPIVREQFEARIDAKMRKHAGDRGKENKVRKGSFILDILQYRVFLLNNSGQVEVRLTTMEFRLLRFFLDHIDHVLSRDQILGEVWGQNLNVSDRTVDTHVYTLRKKLGDYAECINTISGVGYQFQLNGVVKAS